MNEFIQVMVAIDSEEGAHKIAEALVTKHLAAGVWVSGPIISRYWWKGNIEKAEEWVCTVKTRQDLYEEVEQAIRDVHSYKVPGILAIPVVTGSQGYFDWISRETAADEQRDYTAASKEQLLQELIDAHERLIAAATVAFERGVDREGEQWGPREVMAHIAGWEANALIRVPKIVAGAPRGKYDDDAFNSAMIMAIGDQSFEIVRDILRQAYQRDIEMLKKLDESVFVPGNYPYERTKAAISHNYEHTQELDERTERRSEAKHNIMTYSKDEAGEDALHSLDEAHEKLIAAVTAAAARGVKGPWGPREILAHVVGWEVIAIHRLPKLIAGEAPLTYDEDAVNAAMVTLVGDQHLETIRDMLYQAHHRFLQIPEIQSHASFVPGHPVYERTIAAIRHSLEHTQELDMLS